ncbi:SIR2 family protein [Sphingobium sp. B2]|uniref:SIR2 family protein n=1 Tax=Sphingobium sp. B2 TaxID=2583228 RepID=UPI0011A248E5|nr:SIR2 family protein [Sphingobium sp. B2]
MVLIAGAGLSMAAPSNLPSAAAIAAVAKTEYDARYGGLRPPLPVDIEDQAELFFQKGELGVYLNEFIDPDVFAAKPNPGHIAVADLLLSRGLQAAVTTNVDVLVETAGQSLLGQVFTGIDGTAVASPPGGAAPMLKIHGCWVQERQNTVWAPGQLTAPPVVARIASSETWLQNALLDKDLLIVGYSTDWDYLNQVIAQTLGAVSPASVLVVDPSTTANFASKAPDLAALAGRAKKGAFHLQTSGSDFLDELRLSFSKVFIHRAIAKGVAAYELLVGHPPSAPSLEAPDLDNDTLWQVRRDLLGCKPSKPARQSMPHDEPAVGLTLLQIREAGGTADGPYWKVGGRVVRVIRGSGSFLHALEGEYRWDMPPVAAPDVVVAVGADDVGLPADLARRPDGSIARGAGPSWMTRATFEATL